MALRREDGRANLIDILDRVLDKGIVIDAWIRISLAGLDLLDVEARVVIASFETYLHHAQTLAQRGLISSPPVKGSRERGRGTGLKLVHRKLTFSPETGS